MASVNYQTRRDEIETYFDRTAADAWAALTSDAPVSRIRRTVRRGRDAMRETLMGWLPEDLTGACVFLSSPDSDFMTGQYVAINGGDCFS